MRLTLSLEKQPGKCASFIVRQSFGQASTHTLQTIHLSLLSSHDRSTLLTEMAFEGHRFSHIPQKMQVLMLISPSAPRVFFIGARFSYGYIRVAGFETTFFRTFPRKSNMVISYLSVQLMQGSIVNSNTGTSASWWPGIIFKIVGIFANVGVLTRNRSRFFVPLPLM